MRDLFVPVSVRELEPFVRAGILGAAEINVACTFAAADPHAGLEVLLAAALAVRAPLHGSICVDLAAVRDTVVSSLESTAQLGTAQSGGEAPEEPEANTADDGVDDHPDLVALDWPDPYGWLASVRESPLVLVADASVKLGYVNGRLQPLVVEDGRLYLARYWSLERYVAADLRERSRASTEHEASESAVAPTGSAAAADDEVRRLFDAAATADHPVDQGQLAAALAAVDRDFVVISGGPGTGKTTTVARLLAGLVGALEAQGVDRRIALVAPTGKASARMTEAIRQAVGTLSGVLPEPVVEHLNGLEAITIHRLLGRGTGAGFRHGPADPLPHDILIVDEVSMVSLSLMAHLLAAVRPGAKVVLVGDPYQLASVEAGSVLGDIVGIADAGGAHAEPEPPAAIRDSVRSLSIVHRQGAESAILELATAVREGRADDVMALLRSERPDVTWIDPEDTSHKARLARLEAEITDAAIGSVEAARAGEIDRALEAIGGVKVLCALRRGRGGVEGWNQRVEGRLRSAGTIGPARSYSGRPVMVTENDYLNEVFNGDVGVSVRLDDRYQVWFKRGGGNQMVEEVRLDRSVTQWAMSIHKSQGSEFPHAVVALPPPPSRILTRELLYTGVTRAKNQLTIVAGEASIRLAVEHRVARASGLHQRLTGGDQTR
jgi:exodeoxyribonuclease V alpha subunit